MNAKQAKVLRKQAAFLNDKPLSYSHKLMKQTKIPTGRLNAKGGHEEFLLRSITTSLGDCTRKTYKLLKDLYRGRWA